MIYDAVKDFIIKKHDRHLSQAFLNLYPDSLKPCYSCMYKEGIILTILKMRNIMMMI